MADLVKKQDNPIKSFFERDGVKQKFHELLGKRSTQFVTSVLQIATSNKLLANADPISIYNAACVAATLDLPLNNSLGFAWIVPYGGAASMQIGWRGYVQLAQRTGQYKRINVVEVYENQFKGFNALTEELDADFTVQGNGTVVGYCAYFLLINGFEKATYWSIEKVKAHSKKYSKSHASGPWRDEFDKMAKKTVLKHTLAQWGILSIEMNTAIKVDNAVVRSDDAMEVDYVDVPQKQSKEVERMQKLIEEQTTIEGLRGLQKDVPDELLDAYLMKEQELTGNNG